MLNSKKNLWSPNKKELPSRWYEAVDSTASLPEYPRPQFRRKAWLNLNGLWDYVVLPKKAGFEGVKVFEGQILVPFCLESALSGVTKPLKAKEKLWYRRFFLLPEAWRGLDLLLHFEAVDWEAEIWVNNHFVSKHKGGYVPFSFDITRFVKFNEENELVVGVWDPTNRGRQERGKQVLHPWLAFYTAISGIWQTVWIEAVPRGRIEKIFLLPNIDNGSLSLTSVGVKTEEEDKLKILVKARNSVITSFEGKINSQESITIPDYRLWSPKNPFLYSLTLSLEKREEEIDRVESYFGMRKISIKKDEQGIPRFHLNNEQIFMLGTLDQGYWPDGLYTAPTDDALKADIEITKELGFNMIRKHVKIEPDRWYYHCDKLGMLVWQDMPNGGSILAGIASMLFGKKINFKIGRYKKTVRRNYYIELKAMIDSLYNHPSIIVWVPFNEGWGQFETRRVTEYIRILDRSRLIDSASGWVDKKVGDIKDVHKYPGPMLPELEEERVAVLGEFGGLGYKESNHMWNVKKKWAYKIFSTKEELFKNYVQLMEKTKKLIPKGLGAAIYTQITDVEQEINGLLTYDRAVLKFDKEKVRKINESLIKEGENKNLNYS
ncbi:MAG: glycoside hydrolase family 2 protein [Candidatus Heimdallarchaeaceae archaeon]